MTAAVPEAKTQIALFHTIFNVFTVILLIWYPQPVIKAAHFFIRGEDEMAKRRRFQYIGEKAAGDALHRSQPDHPGSGPHGRDRPGKLRALNAGVFEHG